MKLDTEIGSEQGSAIVDLIGFGILLQIPILLFATMAIQTQQQSFAIEAIARHGLRSFALLTDRPSTAAVINQLAIDFGVVPELIKWELNCTPDPNCLIEGTTASLEVRLGELSAYSSQRL